MSARVPEAVQSRDLHTRTDSEARARGRSLVVVLVLACLAAVAFQLRIGRTMVDFEVYRRAGARVLSAERLYRPEDGHYQFKYLPAFALAISPVALVSDRVARTVWFGMSFAALLALLGWSIRALPDRRHSAAVLAGWTVVFMAKFYLHELTLGQANLLLAAVLTGIVVALERDARMAAGLLAGAGVFIKPYAVLLLPWLIVAGGLASAIAAAGTVAAGVVVPSLVYGWSANLQMLADWYRTVTASTIPNLLAADNISVAAMWGKWLGIGGPAAALAAATSAALLAAAVAIVVRRTDVHEPAYLECALLMLFIPVLSPQGWDYVLLLATPAVVCLIDRLRDVRAGWRWAVVVSLALLGLTVFDVLGRRAYARFMMLSVESVCALVLVGALAHLRWRRLA